MVDFTNLINQLDAEAHKLFGYLRESYTANEKADEIRREADAQAVHNGAGVVKDAIAQVTIHHAETQAGAAMTTSSAIGNAFSVSDHSGDVKTPGSQNNKSQEKSAPPTPGGR